MRVTGTPHFVQLESEEAVRSGIAHEQALLVYFTTPDCNVCRVLRAKLADILDRDFPRLKPFVVDCARHPEVAAAFTVFAVPTILVFFERREWLRESRYLSLQDFKSALARPYELIFGSG